MKSENEDFCKSEFDRFVITDSRIVSVYWEDVAQQNEPPDYYLYLDSTKYAVEVTILMEKLEVGNMRLPQIAITASLWRLVDEVEATARKNNCLRGAYVVKFSKPIANLSRIREELFKGLLDYVRVTQNASSVAEKIIFKDGDQECGIQKMHDQKDYIGKLGPGGGKWEGEAAKEICVLLTERINDKHHKLRNITSPKILLLYDEYHFADPEMFKSCLPTLPHLHSFHTIFVAQTNGTGWVMHSENPVWLN